MIGRLLIDECLSAELAQLAIDAGHVESTSVRDRGRLGLKDWELMEYAIEEDFILVTRNAQDFRGAGKANPGGLHGAQRCTRVKAAEPAAKRCGFKNLQLGLVVLVHDYERTGYAAFIRRRTRSALRAAGPHQECRCIDSRGGGWFILCAHREPWECVAE